MITPSNDALYVAIKTFLMSIFTDLDINHIVQGLGNDVPMPTDEFIMLTATAQAPLSTNHSLYGVDLQRSIRTPTRYNVQIDCYGPTSGDRASQIVMMWRDQYGWEALQPNCAPLYCTDPVQVPLVNGEENYEQRWTLTALLQFNPVVTVPQQSATTLKVDLVEVDAQFPPS